MYFFILAIWCVAALPTADDSFFFPPQGKSRCNFIASRYFPMYNSLR
jgi:hypothetical protein